MRFPLSQATRLSDRQTVWVSASDNAKNADGRPSQFVHWGVPTATIAAAYSETHSPIACPVSGWVPQQG